MPTVTSEVQIACYALQHLGERPIQTLTEDSKPARAMRATMPLARQKLLRDHSFNFSRKDVELQRLSDAPLSRYSFGYQLPNDYIRTIALNPDRDGFQRDSYVIEDGALLTDAESATLLYVRDVIEVTKYDAAFVEAFSYKLAIMTCKTITGSDEKVEKLTRDFVSLSLPSASADDATDGRPEQPWHWRDSRFVAARYRDYFGY